MLARGLKIQLVSAFAVFFEPYCIMLRINEKGIYKIINKVLAFGFTYLYVF